LHKKLLVNRAVTTIEADELPHLISWEKKKREIMTVLTFFRKVNGRCSN
jgi:hypothetical protein